MFEPVAAHPHHSPELPPPDVDPQTPASIRAAIDACNAERRLANAECGLHLEMVPYPSWMTEATR
jgi:hypothetical protein